MHLFPALVSVPAQSILSSKALQITDGHLKVYKRGSKELNLAGLSHR